MHHPGTSDATVIERLFASCDLHPRVAAYCDDFNASLAMAASGLGAALVPELALQNGPDGVVVIDVPEVRLARNIFALLLNDRQNPRLDVFMDRLSGILHESSIAPKRR
jgi:DNA-binding transcriptional LysR family regulator